QTKWFDFTDDGLRALVHGYTAEAGLRTLERQIASVCRKVARSHAEGKRRKVKIDARKVHALLGQPKYHRSKHVETAPPGVATGLAWTPVGGETLSIEAIKTPGRNGLKLTGSLGDVMKESAHAGLGYLRAESNEIGIDAKFFQRFEFHVHVPAGAISKDGPSAGVAITASLLSLAFDKPIRPKLAMTGEITLTGRVLPVGGVREKVLAARREGINKVILPADNERDVEELPDAVRRDFTFIYANHMDEVIPHLFTTDATPPAKLKKRKAKVVGPTAAPKPLPTPQPTPTPTHPTPPPAH
ncbi:MAG: S16 family serine protease, partial [Planctomycetia bacterium]